MGPSMLADLMDTQNIFPPTAITWMSYISKAMSWIMNQNAPPGLFLADFLTLNLHFPAHFLMFLGYLINTESYWKPV